MTNKFPKLNPVKPSKGTSVILKIGKLWNSTEGTSDEQHIEADLTFKKTEIIPVSAFTADATLFKMKNEISVVLQNAEITCQFNCNRCLKKTEISVKFTDESRSFLGPRPPRKKAHTTPEFDENENFSIDIKNLTIDLYDMIRQEIILHFPLIPLCSLSCKGLCPTCGKNKNEQKCHCKVDTEAEIQGENPFHVLKNLF